MSSELIDGERNSLMMDIFSHGTNLMVIAGGFREVLNLSITIHGNTTSPTRKESYLTNTVSLPQPDHMSVTVELKRLPPKIVSCSSLLGDNVEIFNDKHHITIHDPIVKEVEDTSYNQGETNSIKMKIAATDYSVEKEWNKKFKNREN